MIELLIAYAVIVTALAKYFYDQWKENEHLFELSKGYEDSAQKALNQAYNLRHDAMRYGVPLPKLNKDGSIAKKRGPKPKVQK